MANPSAIGRKRGKRTCVTSISSPWGKAFNADECSGKVLEMRKKNEEKKKEKRRDRSFTLKKRHSSPDCQKCLDRNQRRGKHDVETPVIFERSQSIIARRSLAS